MANMSYCRFENTHNDLTDCVYAIAEAETIEDMNLNRTEAYYPKEMQVLAQEFLDECNRILPGE